MFRTLDVLVILVAAWLSALYVQRCPHLQQPSLHHHCHHEQIQMNYSQKSLLKGLTMFLSIES